MRSQSLETVAALNRTSANSRETSAYGSSERRRVDGGAAKGAKRRRLTYAELASVRSGTKIPELPTYLVQTYAWAYLRPWSLLVFDHTGVVWAILWGNSGRLARAAFTEIEAGQSVLQPACVYGQFSRDLARRVGPAGRLDIVDIASIQVENCRRKLNRFSNVRARVADAAAPGGGPYDGACCFFLLHELPDPRKCKVVDALLGGVRAGGKVAFVDDHLPSARHPLKAITGFAFDRLEPFAKTMWRREIRSLASAPDRFCWRKETHFGGLLQKVVAESRTPPEQSGRVA